MEGVDGGVAPSLPFDEAQGWRGEGEAVAGLEISVAHAEVRPPWGRG